MPDNENNSEAMSDHNADTLDNLASGNTGDVYPKAPTAFEIECIERDAQATEYFRNQGATTLEHAFTVANILHRNQKPFEAACIYGLAFRIHSKNQGEYPLPQALMQVRLLCFLKAGKELPEHDLQTLAALCRPYANYIESIRAAWRGGDSRQALIHMGNAFEEFVSGEEIDWLYLEIARKIHPSLFNSDILKSAGEKRIPQKLFMYWDKNPPEEVIENLYFHQGIPDMEIKFFNKEDAVEFLYQYYGTEARELFLSMRSSAEAADFLRVHVTNLYGGWWLNADARIENEDALNFMLGQQDDVVLFLNKNHVVHNGFYGTLANSVFMGECLRSLYTNSYKHRYLYRPYKTGPGIFNRALSRIAFRALQGINDGERIKLYDQEKFDEIIKKSS
ncbi:hypothetical protein AA0313_0959 [Acetobacter indonesiensis NRIC 0313]|uniref:Uncharacterized protein n=1 Tax=Acetobacter indonesiensis TaxID=104101 RepID=A0A6N3T8U9_9PROT|nr:hypothetical protein [Acetobacter indonesiensis]GAN62549.1 hypothetical protein Abin_009_022 [Acetobacter indonesiensis]GBQ55782.1 hypothetical protein AA0313_0959 [Acetobacter indonesiensis NRIC 0313]GEN04057.1 hypothetical protein AIN02nite_20820 [Acetobacter indonesiensis]